MKLLFLLLLGILPATALDIPRHVFTLDRLDEAKAKALEDGEPLIFVLTNPDTT